ncbi:MAG: DEAD/DEAH box helicase, partial [Gemmatimonadota bacterium]|nr:DEAD/DEAH box helicase [Gemmatimonadota bacterium]
MARASAGAGKALAYALGVLDRIQPRTPAEGEEGPGVRVLILTPTAEVAERTALSLVPYVNAVELGITVAGGSWGTAAAQAEVVVGAPEELLGAVRGSTLKLDTLEAVILDGASDIQALGGWEAVETIMDHAPRDAQRVVVSAAFTPEIDDLIDRRVKRALRYPAEPALPDEVEPQPMQGTVGYALVGEREKLEVVARFLTHPREGEAPPILFSRTDDRAAEVAEALALRGFVVGESDDTDADVAVVAAGTTRAELAEESGEEPGQTISFDVPPDERTLLARHGGDSRALVLLEPRELAHLQEIARRGRFRLQAVTPPIPESAAVELNAFRSELRRALAEEDLGAQILVLEPLFEE